LIELLSAETLTQEARNALLIGRPLSGIAETGRTVCSCFSVGIVRLLSVIETGAAVTVEDIGKLLRAGTNCGSCVPELRDLIAAHAPAAKSNAA
jgi:assimilatory nitrate reductase catalytic subunit